MSPLSTIPSTIARSWLLLPADRSERFDAAVASEMDVVVLDVEDGVRQSEKEQSRREVRQWLEAGNHAWVRINDVRSPEWEKDLMALGHCPGLDGVMLAKTENAEHVALTTARLAPNTPIVALVESADGLEQAAEIAKSEQVVRLAFGVGDFRRDTGIGSSQTRLAATVRRCWTGPRGRLRPVMVCSACSGRLGGGPGLQAWSTSARRSLCCRW